MRVVTTLPSATEIVAALGIEPVGVSHECDFPPEVESLPPVTESRIETNTTSEEIDRQVLESTTDDDGVYEVDCETLEALEPDLIVTQGMCDVCAVDEAVVADAVDEIDADPQVLTTDPHSVADVLADVSRIGEATGREERARAVRTELEERIDAVQNRTSELGLEEEDRPRVAVFDWTDPAMIAGHWTAELVEWAGGEYGLADTGERSRPREWEEIRAYDPELIVVAPCGFDLAQTAENRSDLTDREGWEELTAVQDGRVWAMDGDHYLNRPGPRLVDTLEALAPIVQPGPSDVGPPAEVAVPFDALETQGSRVRPPADSRAD
ncbi:cobalamin-binding protein [Natronobacterium texcoconense]|uniref:Iron complex transport system substrate-binding protein n=1 Tax=Natronobacterium texcoconense TaxID=1095778 RepID=A0A1H1IN35_NATTX|nr:cobalamin-binding protein [Natronobacterium texcoconense]SDR39072.1 iron complex transport system substrate-binding protein [Natronobacterium texcoconense]